MSNNDNQNFEELYENSLKKLEEGTVVEGTIVDIAGNDIFVDLGYKADGVIPYDEFTYGNEKPADNYKVGDKITAYILKMNNGQGNILLSRKRLEVKKIREDFENSVKEDRPVDAKVVDVVNGGVIAETGNIKIFVPQTQLAKRNVELVEYRGRSLALKIIEYDPSKRKIIGSERKLVNEERQQMSDKLWSEIKEGETRKGVVRQLTEYGAFIDLGGSDALLHISEISWKPIKHPSEVLKVGQEIEVKVLKVDKENKKISLGYRKPEDNPWANIKYQVGDIVTGKVVSMKPFGAFVELEDGLEALVHISNITVRRIAKPQDALELGEEVKAKVVEVALDKKRIELSIRELEGTEIENEVVVSEGTEESKESTVIQDATINDSEENN